jgi:hypothetical protein
LGDPGEDGNVTEAVNWIQVAQNRLLIASC